MRATSAFMMTPGSARTPAQAKPCRAVDIAKIRPRGAVLLPVADETDEPPLLLSNGVLPAAQAICRRLMLRLQAEHALEMLTDRQLRDIGRSRDQIQPPLLAVLAPSRHLWRW